MSMPLSNALQSQIITDAHFLHHPIVDREFTRKLKYARMDSENIYLLLVAITIITMEKALSKLENLILVKSLGHLIM